MSRIGKKLLTIPAGLDLSVDAAQVAVKGPKGTLTVPLPPHAHAAFDAATRVLTFTVDDETVVDQRAIWGLSRQLVKNAVEGVQKPYEKSLEFVGVGFKVALEGKQVAMDVGFSHRVMFPLPAGVEAKIDKQVLTLTSADKYLLGETAARIRRTRPPEPYKGKGIKYVEEVIRRKAGKTAKTAA